MNQPPDGIIITISQQMLKEKGYRNWLRNFLFAMDQHEQGWTYWMRQGVKPMFARAWVILSGPVERPPMPIAMAGFRGFRYTQKLW